MSSPILSILIPTTVGREHQFGLLKNRIDSQVHGLDDMGCVEVIYLKDNKEMPIGEKRSALYQMANGLFSWQIDDDDDIADGAVEIILESIRKNPDVDCITFEEYCLINGVEYRSNHSLIYDDWADGFGGYDFVRTPFYKDVIKTSIAKSVPFEKIRWGEDHAFARALRPHLKTEIHIPEQLYKYIHVSSDPIERYGLDKQ